MKTETYNYIIKPLRAKLMANIKAYNWIVIIKSQRNIECFTHFTLDKYGLTLTIINQ
jgi:hypothetical protein